MAQNMNQANIGYLPQWLAAGNTGDLPAGWTPDSSGGGGSSFGISIPNFQFDWSAAEKTALAQLRPYYQQILNLANGDVERAKQAIESDYQSGKRYQAGEYTGQMAQENITANDEKNTVLNDLNQRGVLFSETGPGGNQNVPQASGQEAGTPTGLDINSSNIAPQPQGYSAPQKGLGYTALAGQQTIDPLLDKQQQRRAAIARAVKRQSDTMNTNYTQNLADQTSKQQQNQLSLGKQMTGEAQNIAQEQYNTGNAGSQFATQNALEGANALLPGQGKQPNLTSGLA